MVDIAQTAFAPSPNRGPALAFTPARECLHHLFEEQADLRPLAPALIANGASLSYGELDARANQLARYLRANGIGPGSLVGIFFERSAYPVIAVLGCLKAGCGYVPLDPVHPEDRMRHIMAEAKASFLLTEQTLAARAFGFYQGAALVMDQVSGELDLQSEARLSRDEVGVSPSDLAYVIYTSGTTGRPKGVMAEHGQAVAYVQAFNEACRTSPSDRVYQGFSLGFDGSVEEIWMAFSNGSALVVGSKTTPKFGDDVARFLEEQGVTYFSTVPTMLSTISRDIGTLTQLVVSGEMCPPELVARWAKPGRKMWNVYGPTEATVNTTIFECVPGKPVTIGQPLLGYDVHILDSDLRPVPRGTKGELCIAGKTLARGYLGRPDLTEQSFVSTVLSTGAAPARIYRTGDLARWGDSGDLEIFGRIDGQIKIRGFRVELAEIEAVLTQHPSVRTASVKLFEQDQLAELAAFVVLEPGATLDRNELLDHLQAKMPNYMIPGYLDQVTSLPMLASGKVDRKQLPAPTTPLVRLGRVIVAAEGVWEERLAALWQRLFRLPQVSVTDDFFLDLGGHSLLAAQLVTALRSDFQVEVAIRDAYKHPTVRQLAAWVATLRSATEAETSTQAAPVPVAVEEASTFQKVRNATLQALSLYILYGLVAIPFAFLMPYGIHAYDGELSWWSFAGISCAMVVGIWPLYLLVGVAAKWILIGRYKEGVHSTKSFYYFRFWLARRMTALSGAEALVGTPLASLYYRAMGAKVGRNCTFDTMQCAAWDLVEIGDETSLGADTQLLGYRVEKGRVTFGSVKIGKRCFVGIHSALGLNAVMGDDCSLDDQSLLPDHAVLANGTQSRGSPAQAAVVELPTPPLAGPDYGNRFVYGAVQLLLCYVLAFLVLLAGVPFFAAVLWAAATGGAGAATLVLLASAPAGVLFYCFYIAGLKWLILRRSQAGVHKLASVFYLRKWFVDRLIGVSRTVLLPLYTTMYLPPWLRLLGAKVGKRAELSTVWYFSPDLLEIGDESFFADGSIVGGRRINRGLFEIGVNRVGNRSFVGNSTILPTGRSLGDGCLLGVLSAPPMASRTVPAGTDWVGSPAFALPNRQKVGGFSTAETFQPTPKLYFQRAIIDALRILIPSYIALGSALVGVWALYNVYREMGIVWVAAAAPLVTFALAIASVLLVCALKWATMGRFKPVFKPLWSMYVWVNEMVNGSYESIMAPAIAPLLGTPFLAPFLRLIGLKVGKRTYIESTLFSEWDLIDIGDDATLNFGAVIQTHLFEDRVFKSSYLKIGAECTVGNMAVVLYDTEMHRGATLGPLSLLMKGEQQNAHTQWHGIPTIPVAPESARA